jgi:hypothetical protein
MEIFTKMKFRGLGQAGQNALCVITALLPPSIIMFHLFAKNYSALSFFHVLTVDAMFTLVSFLFYSLIANFCKLGGGGVSLPPSLPSSCG